MLISWVWDGGWDFWNWFWRFDWGFAGNSLESNEISKLYPALCRGLWISCGLQISWNHHAEFERYTWSAPAAVREAVREVVLSKRLWRDMERLETFGTRCLVNQRGLSSEITWQATSFESADKAEWLVQLICNLKRLPPTFWYSSAATCLLSLQIAQRFGVLGSLVLAIN